jgi:hypothetical protein
MQIKIIQYLNSDLSRRTSYFSFLTKKANPRLKLILHLFYSFFNYNKHFMFSKITLVIGLLSTEAIHAQDKPEVTIGGALRFNIIYLWKDKKTWW